MQIEKARKRFTVDDYYKMAEAGILTPTDRVELIEGEIVEMSPIGNRHGMAVNRANMVFARSLGDQVVVAVQNDVIHVYRGPTGETYALIESRGRGESVSPQAFPNFVIKVDDLLG